MKQPSFHALFGDIGGVIRKSLARGDVLFRQGEPADYVYAVERGELQLVRYTTDGHSVCLHTARNGDSFAEAALFTDRYHCNGEVRTDTTAWCYPRAEVLRKIAADQLCMQQFYSLLAAQVRHLRLLLELRGIRSAPERLLQLLRLRADESGSVRLAGSLLDLAAELGMAHETIYRALAELEKSREIRRLDKRTLLLISSAAK